MEENYNDNEDFQDINTTNISTTNRGGFTGVANVPTTGNMADTFVIPAILRRRYFKSNINGTAIGTTHREGDH